MQSTKLMAKQSTVVLGPEVRKRLFKLCLNREFDLVLQELQKVSNRLVEESFLNVYLAKSVQWAHVESIDYLWYRYVMREQRLMVRPQILCDIGNISLDANKSFWPGQLCTHFAKVYGQETHYRRFGIELLRIKVESFAKSTGEKTSFLEKWNVFLEELDQNVSERHSFSFRDFPHLAKALHCEEAEVVTELLFKETKSPVRNPTTLPMLLNMLILHPHLDPDFKLRLFASFHQKHSTLYYDDTALALLQAYRHEPYRSYALFDFMKCRNIEISAKAVRLFTRNVRGSSYLNALQLGQHTQDSAS
ncbi:LAMI_0H12090g1_1 [Lachancea mirantina]|uniref:LAMI_0H12090g1_1 n=1 Tax=Lachancea mirantina TaxID=1230905 RepID=A0A1G4KH98_9SACH|nr:LAMI_0H12090g1_1 [Lachancea mirantina]